jgi:hypothetical protein
MEFPRGLKKVHVGDYWIAFAYINDENQREQTRQVVGFYRCTKIPEKRQRIPPHARRLSGNSKFAWALFGTPLGEQPAFPITVPSVNEMLKTTKFGQQTLTPITKSEFQKIQQIVRERKIDPQKIPLLGRDPQNEQEVVAILTAAYERFGIMKFERIQCRFPDLLVKLKGKREPVHIEVETYSKNFLSHRHQGQVRNRILKSNEPSERLPVAIACWYHNADGEVSKYVHRVFELRDLLQKKKPMRWGR